MGPQSLTLTGWGVLKTTVFFPDLPSKLQEVAVSYVPYQGKDILISNIRRETDLHSRMQHMKIKNVTYLYFPYFESSISYITECYEAVDNIKDDDEDNPLDENSNICTGPTSGGIAACNGDSGGPLVQYTTQDVGEISNDVLEQTTEYQEFYTTSNYEENNVDTSNSMEAGLVDEIDVYPTNEATPKTKENVNNNKTPVILGIVSWGASPCGQKGAPTVYTKVAPFIDFIKHYIDT